MDNLKECRIRKGVSQYELGKAIGKYQARIWQLEKGYYGPKEWEKEAIARVLGVEVKDIFPEVGHSSGIKG